MLELDRILANPEVYHRAWVEVTMESGSVYQGYIFPKGGPEYYRKVTFVFLDMDGDLSVVSLLLTDKIRLINLGV